MKRACKGVRGTRIDLLRLSSRSNDAYPQFDILFPEKADVILGIFVSHEEDSGGKNEWKLQAQTWELGSSIPLSTMLRSTMLVYTEELVAKAESRI